VPVKNLGKSPRGILPIDDKLPYKSWQKLDGRRRAAIGRN